MGEVITIYETVRKKIAYFHFWQKRQGFKFKNTVSTPRTEQ